MVGIRAENDATGIVIINNDFINYPGGAIAAGRVQGLVIASNRIMAELECVRAHAGDLAADVSEEALRQII